MSYDLQIWSVRPCNLREGIKPRKTWQIVVNPSDKVLLEDVDEEILASIAGVSYLTELNLEGKATKQACQLLHSTARKLAKQSHGVVFDPQTDRLTLPSGV